jgi:hypothetical protein
MLAFGEHVHSGQRPPLFDQTGDCAWLDAGSSERFGDQAVVFKLRKDAWVSHDSILSRGGRGGVYQAGWISNFFVYPHPGQRSVMTRPLLVISVLMVSMRRPQFACGQMWFSSVSHWASSVRH